MTQTTMLITVVGPDGRADLTAPGDTPVDELLPTFIELIGAGADGERWEIGPPGRAPLAGPRTLADQGVADGTILQLRPIGGAADPTLKDRTDDDAGDLEPDDRSPLERTRAALPQQLGKAARSRAALGAAFGAGRLESLDTSPQRENDPRALTRTTPPTPMARLRASWRETDYERRLDDAIRGPRLRRCATIAVVSPKGGVGKTTTTALLGSLFAHLRRDRAIAVDTNPDYGSLGRTLAPDHEVFVDDLLDILDHPELTAAQLDANLGRASDGLMVLPAPTDPARMARLDRAAYARVIERLQAMAGLLVLDCGTGLQEPAAQAAIMAADQLVLVSDAEPSTASLVAEASRLLERAGPPLVLVVNKMPRGSSHLDLDAFQRQVPRARGLVTVPSDPDRASQVARGEFTWVDGGGPWSQPLRELATVLTADWPQLGVTL